MKNVLIGIASVGVMSAALSGCQTMQKSVNLITDNMYVAQLPESSSTKLQIVTDWGGEFSVTPNSKEYRSSKKSGPGGVLAINGSLNPKGLAKLSVLPYTDKEKLFIYENNLNMPKPTVEEKRLYSLTASTSPNFTVTERYIAPNQPFAIRFRGRDSFSTCSVEGTFNPEANSNYRLTGVFGRKCVVIIEKFVTNSRGETVLQNVKFDK
ncbi:hypothetical protein KPY62_00230 [Psychrobacter sp. TAE2020]|uniref:hypothetical protein n=1 Tax=Psychrobacter sp. TAE2020 TaxID=2846762 RepID=UPI001C0F437E|nr:hypothetical protein [Psychrobacter sp. TAE2020]MBU5615547.1 hypothetical protein [Psychrobacter sp. TAE2020]